jgi:hypothetical protein
VGYGLPLPFHFIGGKDVADISGNFANVFNPASGEITAKVAMADAPERNSAENAVATLAIQTASAVFCPMNPPTPNGNSARTVPAKVERSMKIPDRPSDCV